MHITFWRSSLNPLQAESLWVISDHQGSARMLERRETHPVEGLGKDPIPGSIILVETMFFCHYSEEHA